MLDKELVKVVIGVVLTAFLGGLIVPAIRTYQDRRRERVAVLNDLIETLAASMWSYWKLAMRVAYYGSNGEARQRDYKAALKAWDSDQAWNNGRDIQVQVSRSKRIPLISTTHEAIDLAQRSVVSELDEWVEHLRDTASPSAWNDFKTYLNRDKRASIDALLAGVVAHVDFALKTWPTRAWLTIWHRKPAPIQQPVPHPVRPLL